MKARDGGVEMVGGDGSEMGRRRGQKSTAGISASLTPDFRDKEENNYMFRIGGEEGG